MQTGRPRKRLKPDAAGKGLDTRARPSRIPFGATQMNSLLEDLL
jgi:hypothetical protein